MNALTGQSHPVAINGEPTCAVIAEVVAEFYSVRSADLLSQRLTDALTRPRMVAYYLCRTLTSKSLPAIGRHFGGRDHTTVRHGAIKVEAELATNRDLQQEVDAIQMALQDLLNRFGVVIDDHFPDRSAPEIARRVLSGHRGEYSVSLTELRALLNFAASPPAETAAEAAPDPLSGPVRQTLAAFAEFERARFSVDERRALDTLTRELKGLRDAWSETERTDT